MDHVNWVSSTIGRMRLVKHSGRLAVGTRRGLGKHPQHRRPTTNIHGQVHLGTSLASTLGNRRGRGEELLNLHPLRIVFLHGQLSNLGQNLLLPVRKVFDRKIDARANYCLHAAERQVGKLCLWDHAVATPG